MVSAVRGGFGGAVRCLRCLWTVVLRARGELGRFQIAILGPLSRERGGGAFLPGACLHVATVDGPEWIESSLASRTGNRSKQAGLLLCCACAVLGYALWLGGCGMCCGPGGMKRAGPEFTFFFSSLSDSLIRFGAAEEEQQHQPSCPIPSHPIISVQCSTTRRSATQGHGRAAPTSPPHDEGNWPKEQNDKTNGMAPGQQACVPLRMHTLCAMDGAAHLTGLLIAAAPPDPPRYTA